MHVYALKDNMDEKEKEQSNEKILEAWERLKVLVMAAEDDVLKAAKGNTSAGTRARKALRALKAEAHLLVRTSTQEGKLMREAARAARDAARK